MCKPNAINHPSIIINGWEVSSQYGRFTHSFLADIGVSPVAKHVLIGTAATSHVDPGRHDKCCTFKGNYTFVAGIAL